MHFTKRRCCACLAALLVALVLITVVPGTAVEAQTGPNLVSLSIPSSGEAGSTISIRWTVTDQTGSLTFLRWDTSPRTTHSPRYSTSPIRFSSSRQSATEQITLPSNSSRVYVTIAIVSAGKELWWQERAISVRVPSSLTPASPAGIVRTCIAGAFSGWDGDTAFELCNGTVWVQASYDYTYHYAYRPDVLITHDGYQWIMHVEGVRQTIAVKQTEFMKSCIDGTFEGWSGGDTVFVLCNGQVWMQDDYSYHYTYRYRPSVLIYRSLYGDIRMQVDGTDRTVKITRIR